MSGLVHDIESPEEISRAASELRRTVQNNPTQISEVLSVFEAWSAALGEGTLNDIPGLPFLRVWLRRGTLEPILERELGKDAIGNQWLKNGSARLGCFPVGVVGHWPAGNIEIQPVLSMTCALLGGNASIVRAPAGLVDQTRRLLEKLAAVDHEGQIVSHIFMATFEHSRTDLHQAMARAVDGAMIWGGEESVLAVRSLPFPHWARLAVFGPRISAAAMDSRTWANPESRETWCRRIARDVWQFDQQACSSPQVLFLEKHPDRTASEFVNSLKLAFELENQAHPRRHIHPSLTSAICQARASWLLPDPRHSARFPKAPDWTLLLGEGPDIPKPVQGKTLAVLEVEDLAQPISKFDGNVQALGLAVTDPDREKELSTLAATRGVDRIVKPGRMHVFGSPWDGADLVRPMVRIVRHVPSAE
jgi:Acyl-CoA reductase (LuxC)